MADVGSGPAGPAEESCRVARDCCLGIASAALFVLNRRSTTSRLRYVNVSQPETPKREVSFLFAFVSS